MNYDIKIFLITLLFLIRLNLIRPMIFYQTKIYILTNVHYIFKLFCNFLVFIILFKMNLFIINQ